MNRPLSAFSATLLVAAAIVAAPATATATAGSDPPYGDVPTDTYYHEAVTNLAARGVFQGTECADNNFCPHQVLDRRTIAVWIVRALGGSPTEDDQEVFRYPPEQQDERPGQHSFSDVDHAQWQTPYIYHLANLGITVGCSYEPTNYCPDTTVSRDQMASFLARAFALPPAADAGFGDVPADSGHLSNIDRLYAAGLTVGCSAPPAEFNFCPHLSVTRAHLATFLYRALTRQPTTSTTTAHTQGRITPVSTSTAISPPRNVVVDVQHQLVTAQWNPPATGESLVANYLLQWRDQGERFTPGKQLVVAATDDPADLNPRADVFLVAIPDHAAHEVQVIAMHPDGTGSGAVSLSPFSAERLNRIIREHVIEAYGEAHPWLAAVWGLMHSVQSLYVMKPPDWEHLAGVEFVPVPGLSFPLLEPSRLLVRSDVVGTGFLHIYVHELAHIYTLTSALPAAPAPIAIAHLYFQDLITNHSTRTNSDEECAPEEFYADTAEVALQIPSSHSVPHTNYWSRLSDCTGGTAAPSEEAQQVVLSALRGEMPRWLYDTFQNTDGTLALDNIWNVILDIHEPLFRSVVVYQLRNEFGGYCSAADAHQAAHDQRPVAHTWRDGGC